MPVTMMIRSDGVPFGGGFNDVNGMNSMMGALLMRVRRSCRQNPELGNG